MEHCYHGEMVTKNLSDRKQDSPLLESNKEISVKVCFKGMGVNGTD